MTGQKWRIVTWLSYIPGLLLVGAIIFCAVKSVAS